MSVLQDLGDCNGLRNEKNTPIMQQLKSFMTTAINKVQTFDLI